MLDFAKFLKENFNEDVSKAETIIKTKWEKTSNIIKEAFDGKFSNKKTALYKIQNEFVDKRIAPKSIDIDFLTANMNYVIEKFNSLDEGEIKIIINNDIHKGGGCKNNTPDLAPNVITIDDGEDEDLEMESVEKVGKEEDKKKGKKKLKIVKEADEDIYQQKDYSGIDTGNEEVSEEPEDAGEEPEDAGEEPEDAGEEPEDAGEEPEDAGEEPEDAGEEPEDAGEEPEDAGEEPEDAGEEPEDAGEEDFNWEDVLSREDEEGEEEIVPVRPIGSTEFRMEGYDLTNLVDTLVKIDGSWKKVTSITEENAIIVVGKDGIEKQNDFDDIEDMECKPCQLQREPIALGAEEEVSGIEMVLNPEQLSSLKDWVSNPEMELDDDIYSALIDYYGDKVPYEVLKARDVDPYEWLHSKVKEDLGAEEEVACDNAEEEVATPESTEESFRFVDMANKRYFDIDEDAPVMTTQIGISSKIGAINQKVEKPGQIPKGETKTAPEAALTAKPSNPGETIEPVGNVPNSPTKPESNQNLTAKPSKPPKKIENVKAPTDMPSKKESKAALTSKPSKPKTNISNVKAPNIPSEYKTGGFKG